MFESLGTIIVVGIFLALAKAVEYGENKATKISQERFYVSCHPTSKRNPHRSF